MVMSLYQMFIYVYIYKIKVKQKPIKQEHMEQFQKKVITYMED